MSDQDQDQEPKQKHFEDQFDDEDVQFVFRKHPVVMRKGLVFGMFGPLIGVVPAFFFPTLGFGWFFGGLLGGFVLGGLIFFPSWINWYYSVFIVTNQRMIQISQKGLFHRTNVDLGLNKIQSINYEVAGLQATLLSYGTILVQTYMGDLVVHHIHHPAKICKQLQATLKEQGITPDPLEQQQEEELPEIEAEEA